jgi:hypothetical protein
VSKKKKKTKTEKTEHKVFRIGEMVTVFYKKNWYVGKYYCWDIQYHGVRFPIHGPYGPRLEIFWVKDGPKINTYFNRRRQ